MSTFLPDAYDEVRKPEELAAKYSGIYAGVAVRRIHRYGNPGNPHLPGFLSMGEEEMEWMV